MSAFQTDSLNPSALPSSTLGRRRPAAATTSAFDADPSGNARPSKDPDATARERFHEEWNVRIDKEVKALATGLSDIVDRADIGPNPSAHSSTPVSLHLQLRTAQLIRSAQSLRDMAHELRLMLLLSDEVDTARRRDVEMKSVKEELGDRRRRVDKQMRLMLSVDHLEEEMDVEVEEQIELGRDGSGSEPIPPPGDKTGVVSGEKKEGGIATAGDDNVQHDERMKPGEKAPSGADGEEDEDDDFEEV